MALSEPRQRSARHQPAAPSERRAPLRVVRTLELTPRARSRRAGLALAGAALLVLGGLVGVVAAHVALTKNQFRLDRLHAEVAAAQATNAKLQYQVAQLRSPGRIVQTAESRLHMVLPATVTYLPPVTAVQGPAQVHPSQNQGPTGAGTLTTTPAPAAAAPSRAATATTAGGVRR